MTLIEYAFSRLRTPKSQSDKCLKSLVLQDASTSKVVNVPKHSWNLHHSIFIIFIDHCQVNRVGNILSYWHAKSGDCLLTHWLPMKSKFFFIGTIYRYQLRCNYLRTKNFFIIFLLQFWNLNYLLNILKKRWPSQLLYFQNYGLWKRG